MLKKISLGNVAAKITASSITSTGTNSLISYTTEDPHNLYEGARVTVIGLGGAVTGCNPNVVNGIVYQIPSATTMLVHPQVNFTATTTVTIPSSNPYATLYSVNGSAGTTKILYAQPTLVIRPINYNYIYPTITPTYIGSGFSLALTTTGVANPAITSYVIARTYNGSTTNVYSSSTSPGSTFTDTYSFAQGASVTYTYTVINAVASNTATANATTTYINQVSTPTATPTMSTALSIDVSWSIPATNATIASYTVTRSDNGVAFSAFTTTTSNAITDTTVVATHNYAYKVQATDTTGYVTSTISSASTAVAPYYIVAPASVTATPIAATANSLSVSFGTVTANPAVTSYQIQRASSSDNATWSAWADVTTATSSPFIDSGLSNLYYKYQVRAVSPQLNSSYTSSTGTQPYFITAGSASASYVSTSSVSILVGNTSASSNPAINSWKVERSTDNTTYTTLSASTSVPYTDSSVSQSTLYYYRLTPSNAQLTSTPTTPVSITTYGVPSTPSSFNVTAVGATTTNIFWNSSTVIGANTVVSYNITRSTDNVTFTAPPTNSSGISPTGLSSSTTFWADTNATANTTYYYRVYATNGIGNSGNATGTTTTPRVTSTSTITADANSVQFTKSQVITVNVTPAVAGRSVSILRQASVVASGTTDSFGNYSYTYTASGVESSIGWSATVAQDSTYTSANTTSVLYTTVTQMPLSITWADTLNSGSLYNSGTSNTITLTIKDSTGAVKSNIPVTMYYTTYGNGYSTSGATTNASGNVAYSYNSRTESYSVYADLFTSGQVAGANYSWSPTADRIYYIAQATGNVAASATRSYDGAGALRFASSTTLMYHGYFDSTNGNQKSAIWFSSMPWARIHDAHAVSSAYLIVTRTGSGGNSTNTPFYIGTHGTSAVQSTYAGIGSQNPRLDSVTLDWNQASTSTTGALGSAVLTQFATAAYGILIGPPTSTSSTYYGILDNAATLNITYYSNPTL